MFAEYPALYALVFGVALAVLYASLKSATKSCTTKKLDSANMGVLAMAILTLVGAVGYYFCSRSCKDDASRHTARTVFLAVLLLIGAATTALGVSAQKASKDNGCTDAHSRATWVTALGAVTIVYAVAAIAFTSMMAKKGGGGAAYGCGASGYARRKHYTSFVRY